jgi:hypothetical protein
LLPGTHLFELNNALFINATGATSSNQAYAAFGGQSSGGGNLLVTGSTVYEFEFRAFYTCSVALTGTAILFTFGGGPTTGVATFHNYNYEVTCIPTASGVVSTAPSVSNWYGTATTMTSIGSALVTAAGLTPTGFSIRARGIISVNAGGSLAPLVGVSVTQSTATITVQPGSFFKLTPVGTASATGTLAGNVIVGNFTSVF